MADYESPINVIYGQMRTQLESDILKAVQSYDINVDKEELIKALKFDRGQYKKGYEDGRASVLAEIVECKDCAVPHNHWTGCPKLNGLVTPPDFYCGFGERREENAAD